VSRGAGAMGWAEVEEDRLASALAAAIRDKVVMEGSPRLSTRNAGSSREERVGRADGTATVKRLPPRQWVEKRDER
jgi:hypothetical protein